jgi:hypothetical protein
MGEYWRRLLACERRTEHFLRLITELKRQVAVLQQQLRDLRGNV